MVVESLFLMVPLLAWGQLRCDLPNVRGIASIRGDRTYLAVWTHTDEKESLDIYGGLQCSSGNRVAHFEDDGISWQSLSAVEDSAVLGFRVRAEAGEDWFGATKLFMYDGKSFRKSFDSGEVAEIIDLDGDGYPEVLEFLGGKGSPNGKVRVWAWRQDKFRLMTTVSATELLSARLLARLARKSSGGAKPTDP